MVYADLHAHTTASDGELTVDALPTAAARAGVDAVAVTDHDRVNPALDAPVERRDGVTVIRGVELRVTSDAGRVDLLGYGVRKTPGLVRELARLQRDRIERGRAITERVEDRLGVGLDVPARLGVGRPHVARAVVAHPDTDYDEIGPVFEQLIGEGQPCYVARDIPPFETGVELLREAAGLVGLAHPLRYDDPGEALALAADLDAVEREYPYGHPVDRDAVDRVIERHGLVPTGGSDAHGTELGATGLDREAFDRVRAALD